MNSLTLKGNDNCRTGLDESTIALLPALVSPVSHSLGEYKVKQGFPSKNASYNGNFSLKKIIKKERKNNRKNNSLPSLKHYRHIVTAPSALTAAVLVADVGESPHVAEVDRKADDGQQKLHLLVPCLALDARLGLFETRGRLRVGGRRGGESGRRRRLCVTGPGQRGPRDQPRPGSDACGHHQQRGAPPPPAPRQAAADIAALGAGGFGQGYRSSFAVIGIDFADT